MTQAVEKLLHDALALPDDEQLQFVSALVAAVDERGLRAFDDSWLAEIARRSAEYDAGGWYQDQSARAAAGFEAAMDVALERIAKSPESWSLCDERHRMYTLKRYPFSVIYRMAGDDVLVVAVAHASRRESYWHGR